MDLDNIAFRYRKMMHALGHYHVRPGLHVLAGICVNFVTDSNAENP